MRRVAQIPPTASYADKVKRPGEEFLALIPRPSRNEFNRHDYWREIHDEMYEAYNGICMYCASWTPRTAIGTSFQQSSIDHFIAKTREPAWAYEWSNFRLCRNDINTNKGVDIHVPDPYWIRGEWFEIDFATWRIGPTQTAPVYIFHRIRSSFVRLGLNEDAYIEERQNVVALYIHYPADRAELLNLYPFIISEVERQIIGTDLLRELRGILPRPDR